LNCLLDRGQTTEPEHPKWAKLITAFILKDDQYGRPNIYSDEEEMKPSIFADLIVNLAEVFADIEVEED